MSAAPWYGAGLRFGCTRCNACCRGRGIIEVDDDDIERLAERLGLEPVEFRAQHTRPLRKGRLRLREQRGGACLFLHPGRGCVVYESRPAQCRSYPFWPSILFDRESWTDEAQRCPGIEATDAPWVGGPEIGLALECSGQNLRSGPSSPRRR